MKRLTDLKFKYNGQTVSIANNGVSFEVRDNFGNSYWANPNDLEVTSGGESPEGNMDIVRMYIDDLRGLSNLKKD